MDPADVVLRFLESMGRRSEAEFYLALFRAEPKERFAAIAVDANVARHATEAVTLDLRFLAALGLVPVVVLGLLDGKEAGEHGARIKRRLERAGTPAAILTSEGAALHEEALKTARAGTIPIVPFGPAEGPLSAAQIEERFGRLAALVGDLRTRKLIFLHRPGGLRRGGALVPLCNLTTDFDALSSTKELSRKERALLAQSRRLVFEAPHKLLVTISSPLDLLRELFTVKGAGTLLRRGSIIERREGFDAIDRDRLRALLESSFGRPPDDGFFSRPASDIYVADDYRGAAVLRSTPLGPYLTKFAVDREAQGEGVGSDLWVRLVAERPTVFWRARPTNPIDAWYNKQCDGLARFPDWHVYWKNLASERIPEAIAYSLAQPIDIPPSVE
jgi:bifunctional N-acetylglutamate synthase/kinase